MADDSGAPTAGAPAASSRLAEQATAKADLSYSYWAAGAAKAGASTIDPAIAPKKLTEEEAAALQEQQRQRAASGGATSTSAWNSAGTFEERDVTEWAKGAIKQALLGAAAPNVRVTSVDDCRGHASIWFVRGSKRAGFEFSADVSWEYSSVGEGAGGGGGEGVKGTFKLVEAGPDDLDDLELSSLAVLDRKPSRAAAEAAALNAARALEGPVRAALRAFYEDELRQR